MSNLPELQVDWRKKILSGSGGVFCSHVINRLLGVLQMSWYAHLFNPEFIGFFTFVVTVVFGFSLFAEWGIRPYLVKHRGEDLTGLIQVGMLVQSVISVVMMVLIVITSPLLGSVFSDDRLPGFLILLSITVVTPFFTIMTAEWEREYKFFRINMTETLQIATAIIVATIAYYAGMGLMSLFAGYLSGFSARMLYITLATGGKFRLYWPDSHTVKQILNFSRPMMVVSVCSFLVAKGDDLLVKYYWGNEELGIYVVAFYLPFLLLELVTLVTRVTFPAFADRQFDNDELRHAFSITNQYTSVAAFPLAAILYFLSEPIVHLLFGSQWDRAIPVMELFTIAFILRAVTGMQWGSIALIRNRTSYLMWVSIIGALFLFVVGAPLIENYGIMGGAYYSLIQLGVMGPLVRLPLLKQELGSLSYFFENWPSMLSGLLAFAAGFITMEYSAYLAIAAFMATYFLVLGVTAGGLVQHGREFMQRLHSPEGRNE